MKILVVGGGGREHAIIKSLKKSPRVSEIYAAPGNGGIAADAICTGIGAKDLDAITAFAKDNAIDFAVVATIPWSWARWTGWKPSAFPASAPTRLPPFWRAARSSPRTL